MNLRIRLRIYRVLSECIQLHKFNYQLNDVTVALQRRDAACFFFSSMSLT